MIHKDKENKSVTVIKDITCDSCGKSCINKSSGIFECMNLKGNWGYGTKKDNEKWTAQVCENCVDTKFNFVTFKKEEYENVTRKSTPEEEEDYLDRLLVPISKDRITQD